MVTTRRIAAQTWIEWTTEGRMKMDGYKEKTYGLNRYYQDSNRNYQGMAKIRLHV